MQITKNISQSLVSLTSLVLVGHGYDQPFSICINIFRYHFSVQCVIFTHSYSFKKDKIPSTRILLGSPWIHLIFESFDQIDMKYQPKCKDKYNEKGNWKKTQKDLRSFQFLVTFLTIEISNLNIPNDLSNNSWTTFPILLIYL